MKIIIILVAITSYVLGDVPVIDSAETQWQSPQIHLKVQEVIDTDDEGFRRDLQSFQEVHGRNAVEDAITRFLESFREVVINGNDVLPPLDPVTVDHLGPYYYTYTGVRATVNVNAIRMEGLRWYTVDRVDFNILRLIFGLQMTVPRITLESQYDVRARLALLIVHTASGRITFEINRLQVAADARLGTNILGGGHLVLRELDIVISADNSRLRITGMTGSSILNAVISNVVNTISEGVIQDALATISETLSVGLFDTINEFLKDYRLVDIIG